MDMDAAKKLLEAYATPHKRQFAKFRPYRHRTKLQRGNGYCKLYIIEMLAEDRPVKVGIATDVRGRLWNMQCNTPFEVRIIATADAHHTLEETLHKFLAEDRIRGEWFRRSPRVNGLIEAINSDRIVAYLSDQFLAA
jgi:hypothetical protein